MEIFFHNPLPMWFRGTVQEINATKGTVFFDDGDVRIIDFNDGDAWRLGSERSDNDFLLTFLEEGKQVFLHDIYCE